MFGENVKNLRIENRLTQDELAQKIGVSRSTVSAWENGKTEADFKTLSRLRDFFDITYEELLD